MAGLNFGEQVTGTEPICDSSQGFPSLAEKKLDQITSEDATGFAAHRQGKHMQVSSINSSLRVLRRLLRLAVQWGVIPACPKINLLRGERHRERVVTPMEELKYIAAAPEPLCSIATALIDTGMRPEERFRLRWESLTWSNGRHGSLLVTHGKTSAARRMLPMTPRVRAIRSQMERPPRILWKDGFGRHRQPVDTSNRARLRSNTPERSRHSQRKRKGTARNLSPPLFCTRFGTLF